MLVALTGWGQKEDRDRTKEVGFDAHLVKPVDFDVLTKLLAKSGAGSTASRLCERDHESQNSSQDS